MIDHMLYAIADTTRIPVAVITVSDPFALPYQLPEVIVERSPDEATMAADVQSWTGWSNRTLADVIGTTHPTIRALLDGRVIVIARNPDYRRRLKVAHAFVQRVFIIAGRDTRRTQSILSDSTLGDAPIQYLKRDDPAEGFSRVLELVSAGPSELIQSWRPLSSRGRTIAPFDSE